jgi:ribose-phosphate pyrophosphokinase
MLKLNNKIIEFKHFPNKEVFLEKSCLIEIPMNTISFIYQDDNDIFNLILLKSSIKNPTILNIGYMPYSRMDRDNFNYVFSLKILCKIINDLNFIRVIVGEPHSDVCMALLDNARAEYYTKRLLHEFLKINKGKYIIMYPDIGAYKRYFEILSNDEFVTGNKIRDFKTGYIKEYDIINNGLNLADKKIIIIDDLCSKGGTFLKAGGKLKSLGVKDIYLIVGHCENHIFEGDLLKSEIIKEIWTTNTILSKRDKKIIMKEVI